MISKESPSQWTKTSPSIVRASQGNITVLNSNFFVSHNLIQITGIQYSVVASFRFPVTFTPSPPGPRIFYFKRMTKLLVLATTLLSWTMIASLVYFISIATATTTTTATIYTTAMATTTVPIRSIDDGDNSVRRRHLRFVGNDEEDDGDDELSSKNGNSATTDAKTTTNGLHFENVRRSRSHIDLFRVIGKLSTWVIQNTFIDSYKKVFDYFYDDYYYFDQSQQGHVGENTAGAAITATILVGDDPDSYYYDVDDDNIAWMMMTKKAEQQKYSTADSQDVIDDMMAFVVESILLESLIEIVDYSTVSNYWLTLSNDIEYNVRILDRVEEKNLLYIHVNLPILNNNYDEEDEEDDNDYYVYSDDDEIADDDILCPMDDDDHDEGYDLDSLMMLQDVWEVTFCNKFRFNQHRFGLDSYLGTCSLEFI